LSSVNWRRNSGPNRHRNPFLDKEWRRETPNVGNAPPSAEFVGLHEKLIDEDLDLVGGWHELPL